MNRRISILLVVILCASSYSQVEVSDEYEAEQYSCSGIVGNVKSSQNLKTSGVVFLTMAAGLTVIGSLMSLSGGGTYYERDVFGNETGTIRGGLGGIFIGIGIPLMVPSIIMTAIGAKNKRMYLQRFEEMKCSPDEYEKQRQREAPVKRSFGGVQGE